jgi:hypothetical protein
MCCHLECFLSYHKFPDQSKILLDCYTLIYYHSRLYNRSSKFLLKVHAMLRSPKRLYTRHTVAPNPINHPPPSLHALPRKASTSGFSIDRQIQLISILHRPTNPATRRQHFASQILALAHHEYQELWILQHLTTVGAPFEGCEGMKVQVEMVRQGLVCALERWRTLVEGEVEASQGSQGGREELLGVGQ